MTASNHSSFIRPDEFWRQVGLRGNQVIVHLGCGAGFYLIPAAHIVGKAGKAIGVDILPDMLAEVDGNANREGVASIIQTVRANLENDKGSTLEGDIADWVLVANILHQSDPSKILTEAARVVKKDGKVAVIEWDVVATPFGPPAEARLAQNEVVNIASQVGLSMESSFKPSPYHYGLILTKQG